MKTTTSVLLLAAAVLTTLLGACTRKQETAQVDTASAVAAPQTTHDTSHSSMDGMRMTGNVAADMVMMDSMMMRGLGEADSNYDDRFIAMMVPHHQGAVMMAQDALGKSTHPELKDFARSIITSQTKEIAEMEKWDRLWYGHIPDTAGRMARMNRQMTEQLGQADSNYDRNFLDAMIPHHAGAVAMAHDALQKSRHPDIQILSKNIISSQQREIEKMRAMKKRWYGQ